MKIDITELLIARKNLTDELTNKNWHYEKMDKMISEINKQIEKIDKLILVLTNTKTV